MAPPAYPVAPSRATICVRNRTDSFMPAIPTTITDAPPGYPSEWEQDAVLKDGGTVQIRPIVPADSSALQEFVQNMSSETSYFRFFRVKHELTADELQAFTELDYNESMAFVAVVDGELVGVGRYGPEGDDVGDSLGT